MKLNEIKQTFSGEVDLMEGVIPPQISMTLEQVIRDGKVTNNVQYFIIAGLVEMFKNGGPSRWPRDINSYPMSTSAAIIEEVKELQEEDAVNISIWLLNELQGLATFESNPHAAVDYFHPQMGITQWMELVTKKQR